MSPSFVYINKDKLPLPWLTPGVQRKACYSKQERKDDYNPFMKKIRMHHNYDKRNSFKLRSANPSFRRRKNMGYLNTDNSPCTNGKLEPKLLFKPIPTSLHSLDVDKIPGSIPATSKSYNDVGYNQRDMYADSFTNKSKSIK